MRQCPAQSRRENRPSTAKDRVTDRLASRDRLDGDLGFIAILRAWARPGRIKRQPGRPVHDSGHRNHCSVKHDKSELLANIHAARSSSLSFSGLERETGFNAIARIEIAGGAAAFGGTEKLTVGR